MMLQRKMGCSGCSEKGSGARSSFRALLRFVFQYVIVVLGSGARGARILSIHDEQCISGVWYTALPVGWASPPHPLKGAQQAVHHTTPPKEILRAVQRFTILFRWSVSLW